MAETTERASDIVEAWLKQEDAIDPTKAPRLQELLESCLLYTSDAADE